jgi:hypothetical protein
MGPFLLLLFLSLAGAGRASLDGCIDLCVHNPAPAGSPAPFLDCCGDPKKSSFSQPSCATGCLIMDYAQNVAECEKMCEDAPGSGCEWTIPRTNVNINMCSDCNCGLRDCPWAHPEPETCKDPAKGGPEGGDCGWVHRCRGSKEGCMKGCAFRRQAASTTGLVFSTVLLVLLAVYVGGGIALGASGGKRLGPAAHPHYGMWLDLRGLVSDGARMAQRRVRPTSTSHAVAVAREPLTGAKGKASGSGGAGGNSPSKKQKKSKGGGSPSSSKQDKGSKMERQHDSRESSASGSGGEASPSATVPAGLPSAPPGTAAAGGGGRWVHVPN